MQTTRKKRHHEDPTSGLELHMVENPGIGGRICDAVVILLVSVVAFCSIIPLWHVMMSSVSDGQALMAHKEIAILPVGKRHDRRGIKE